MVSEGGGGAFCGAASKSIAATECASRAGVDSRVSGSNVGSMGSGRVRAGVASDDCAIRSAAVTVVVEAKGCTFSCVPNEMKVGSDLLGGAGITGAVGLDAAGATGAAGTITGTGSLALACAGPSDGK